MELIYTDPNGKELGYILNANIDMEIGEDEKNSINDFEIEFKRSGWDGTIEFGKDNDPALFVGSKKPNSRLTKTGIEDIIRRIGEKAGVENAYPHRFRRTALTNALNRGMPLQEAMIFAGHAKSETTMRYCTVNQEGVRYHHFKYLSA